MIAFGDLVTHVFFDVGGTLLDLSCCYLGVVESLERLGIASKATPADLTRRWADLSQEFIGSKNPEGPHGILEATTDAMLVAMNDLGVPGDREIASQITNAAWTAVRRMAKPFPDALPALFRQLRDLGLSLGIITDGDPDVVDNLLPRVPCLELFDTIVCSWEVGATKPNERIFARALESSGCTARTSAFVGDAPADVQGAKSSGLFAIIVDRSNSYPGKPKPDIIVRSLVELPRFLSG